MKTVVLFFAMALFTVAMAAETYDLTLFQESVVAGEELKAGDYKLVVDDGKVVFKKGRKTKAEATARVESNGEKYRSTSIRYENGDGKYRISEIRLGGTNQKLVLN